MRWDRFLAGGTITLAWLLSTGPLFVEPSTDKNVLLLVSDPLSRELACTCVKGFGQRNYRRLATSLETHLNQKVSIEYTDDVAESLKDVDPKRPIIIIGDRSTVEHDVKKAAINAQPVLELTDPEGNTTLTASFIALTRDPIKELKDAAGRKLFFGLAEADQKFTASLEALRTAGIRDPKPDKRGSFSDMALDVLDSSESPAPLAVVPSYALRLLDACGSVTPGSFKVIGQSQPAPFITVFFSEGVSSELEERIRATLLAVKSDSNLLQALESKGGFIPIKPSENPKRPVGVKPSAEWPDWRGTRRDGLVAELPSALRSPPKVIWKKGAAEGALAGLAVAQGRVISAERDLADERDVYRCFDAEHGDLIWRLSLPAPGNLDYGQSPRATPVINGGHAYLLGAFGHLRCVTLDNGKVVWERDLIGDFGSTLPTWGMCSPPLVIDDLLIVHPGAPAASLAALDKHTGQTRWTSPGAPAAYSAFISANVGTQRQIIGYDRRSLGGWDAGTGRRFWQLVPRKEGDFNVPTPIVAEGQIIVSTENNGTRMYAFDPEGNVLKEPTAEFAGLAPTTASSVIACGKLFGAHHGLYCLDLKQKLKPLWYHEEELGDHATLFADAERVLVITLAGELILLDAKANHCSILSRTRLFEDDVEIYAHPALVGTRLYARGTTSVACFELDPTELEVTK